MRNTDDLLFLHQSNLSTPYTLQPRSSQDLKMSINRLPTIDLQNILIQVSLLIPRMLHDTHLRTSTKCNHQIHFRFKGNILSLLTCWCLKGQSSVIIMNWDIHKQIQRRRRELRGFDAYFMLNPIPPLNKL